ncbi:MAG TPA: hypothetical protein H9763_10620 [Candidatus Eisenbergiella merdigallinarum]|uniref:AP2/ERF domain-containing protein n=1 Tax=Candidatus Eisenbergiella merdigallinarum TaxID=2838552 RepID=A0A9D2SEE1_9FIRM|nr:hypothetical protein [Candidatus Eisenbergiella merdigallinarum]
MEGKMRAKDLTGQKFGRLTALYPTGKRDHKGSVIWHCACDCGGEAEVSQDGLGSGNCKSCGCWKKEVQKKVPTLLHRVDGTCVEWLEKRKHRRDNTSGFRGVYRIGENRYRVQIGFKGQRFYVGSYPTFEEAIQARLEAEALIHDGFVRAYRSWQERYGQDEEGEKEHPFVYEVQKKSGKLTVTTSIV